MDPYDSGYCYLHMASRELCPCSVYAPTASTQEGSIASDSVMAAPDRDLVEASAPAQHCDQTEASASQREPDLTVASGNSRRKHTVTMETQGYSSLPQPILKSICEFADQPTKKVMLRVCKTWRTGLRAPEAFSGCSLVVKDGQPSRKCVEELGDTWPFDVALPKWMSIQGGDCYIIGALLESLRHHHKGRSLSRLYKAVTTLHTKGVYVEIQLPELACCFPNITSFICHDDIYVHLAPVMGHAWPALTTLELLGDMRGVGACGLRLLCEGLPQLQHLTIRADLCDEHAGRGSPCAWQALRTLHLQTRAYAGVLAELNPRSSPFLEQVTGSYALWLSNSVFQQRSVEIGRYNAASCKDVVQAVLLRDLLGKRYKLLLGVVISDAGDDVFAWHDADEIEDVYLPMCSFAALCVSPNYVASLVNQLPSDVTDLILDMFVDDACEHLHATVVRDVTKALVERPSSSVHVYDSRGAGQGDVHPSDGLDALLFVLQNVGRLNVRVWGRDKSIHDIVQVGLRGG